MKRFWKVAAWTLLFLVLLSGVWVSAIALGWLEVPRFVTDQVAKVKSLTEDQAAKLNRTVNLYRVRRRC